MRRVYFYWRWEKLYFKKPGYQIQMMETEFYSHYEPVSYSVLQTSSKSLTSEYQCLIDEKAIFSWKIAFIYVCI